MYFYAVGPVYYVRAFGYVDDVALVALSLYSLKCIIATCEELPRNIRLHLNHTK